VAIRFGELQDSTVVAQRIGKSIRYVVAAPEYLKGRKLPAEPADLESHDCVLLRGKNNEGDWELISGKKQVRVHVPGSVSSRDSESVTAFVLRGHGVGMRPSNYCDEAIAQGKLVRLLPKWSSGEIPIFAVYPSRKFLPARLSAFLQTLTAWRSPLW